VKRALDGAVALAALALLWPLLLGIACAVWLEDRGSPWFRGVRVARGGGEFRMLKFRSMRLDAWKTGVHSTAEGDARITRIGRFLRRAKLDELPQLWNVLRGEMSLVGPRPQVPAEAALYTGAEARMLKVRPGITDLASLVFFDEGEILEGSTDPDLLYNQIIRPWKSRLALLCIERSSLGTDWQILFWTVAAPFARRWVLARVGRLLDAWGVGVPLRQVVRREAPLVAYPPPGGREIVSRARVTGAAGSPSGSDQREVTAGK
jgi:lipopolysaccharide/colanic/teichoic acid biosynthesis glycosyltransferase